MDNNHKHKIKDDHQKKKLHFSKISVLVILIGLLAGILLMRQENASTRQEATTERCPPEGSEATTEPCPPEGSEAKTEPCPPEGSEATTKHLPPEGSAQGPINNKESAPNALFWTLKNAQLIHSPTKRDPAIINEWKGILSPTPDEIFSAVNKSATWPYKLQIRLPNDLSLQINIQTLKSYSPQRSTLKGNIEGYPYGRFLLSQVNGTISGLIRLPEEDRVYEIRPSLGPEHFISEIDAQILGNSRE